MENEKIKQIRMNALVAEYIYSDKMKRLNLNKLIIDIFTIILPIIITAILYIIKGTGFETIGNPVSIIISAILSGLVILSLLTKLDDNKLNYFKAKKDNIYIASEALKLLKNTNDEELNWFYSYVAEMDARDSDLNNSINPDLKIEAYRDALKRLIPGSSEVICPICKSSPFIYQRGSCQVCGNKPMEEIK